ncbi:MAG: GntR family transcriptional regulator [Acidobacteriota bacterium]|nr:GntR family transcriptional regulator [Acidobacteriota bacterium]
MKRNTRPAQTSSERVYRHLKHDIVTCDFLPGKSLSEQELCRRYHTSRTPIREACRHLEKDGLIKIIPFRGYFVAPLTMAEYHNLNEVQLIVEPAAAALAAQRATPDQLHKIQEWAEYVYRVGNQKSYYTFLDRNYSLHVGIASASGNDSLFDIVSEVHTRLMRFFYLVISVDSYGPELVTEHREIVRAIGNRDPECARQRTAEHIIRTMQRSANLLLTSTRSQLGFLGQATEWPALAAPSASEVQPFSGAVELEEDPQQRRTNR